jgi:energy-coupling factor transporter transmembrane protein EcfT
MESEILLLDEAYTGLDGFNQKKITDLISSFKRTGKTVIITTHSMETAALADKVGVMAEEKLAAFGTPREIFGLCWDPRWGLALPWTAVVSRCLAARALVPPAAVPLTAEELFRCLTAPAAQDRGEDAAGKSKAEQIEAKLPAAEGPLPGKIRVRAKRKKTGIEFFRSVSFEEFPPGSSPLQDSGGGLKLILLLSLFAATLIVPPPFFTLGILAVILLGGWFAGRTGPVRLLRGFFRILPWLLIVCAVQLIFRFEPARSAALLLRIASLSALLSLFCTVTPLRELVRVFNRVFSFFSRFGFPARSFSLAAGIAIRFIPVLSEEAEHIVSAQLSRGGKKGRFRMAFSLIVPLFLRALERADVLAKAMILRCYRR